MMNWFSANYGKQYAPNTRETIRRQSIHQFVQMGLATNNPGQNDLPVNSPKTVSYTHLDVYKRQIEHFCKEPRFHTYLHELHQAAFAHHDVLTVGECADLKVADAIAISDPARGELNMAFLFEHTDYYHLSLIHI